MTDEATAYDQKQDRRISDVRNDLQADIAGLSMRVNALKSAVARIEEKLGKLEPLEGLAQFADELHHLLGEVRT